MTNSEQTTLRRQRYKDRIVQVMGGKCQCCGYSKYNGALELHHINPKEKEFSISTKTYIAWERLENELKKCVLLCANCHREVEAELIDINFSSSFNQEIYNNIQLEIDEYKQCNKYYCLKCGTEITEKAKLCCECYKLSRQVCQRPTREELKTFIKTESFVSIAKKYGVTDNTIRKWCKAYNLPYRKADIINFSTEDWDNL